MIDGDNMKHEDTKHLNVNYRRVNKPTARKMANLKTHKKYSYYLKEVK